jgi:hypothetical protein
MEPGSTNWCPAVNRDLQGHASTAGGPVQYADASPAESAINIRMISACNVIFSQEAGIPVEIALETWREVLVRARGLHRMEIGEIHGISRKDFDIAELLIRVPLQRWPLPYSRQCLNVHCWEFPEMHEMQSRLESHERIWEGGVYSENSVILASMLGTTMEKADRGSPVTWMCPFGTCSRNFESNLIVADHIELEHGQFYGKLYREAGAFWMTIICFLREVGRWPTFKEMTKDREVFKVIDKWRADLIWQSVRVNSHIPMGTVRESVSESIGEDLHRYASTEGINMRAREIEMHIWNTFGEMPPNQKVELIGKQLQEEQQDWMDNQAERWNTDKRSIIEWKERLRENMVAGELQERQNGLEERIGERFQTEAEQEMSFWMSDTISHVQMERREYPVPQIRGRNEQMEAELLEEEDTEHQEVREESEEKRDEEIDRKVEMLYEALFAEDEGEKMEEIMEEIARTAEDPDEPHAIAINMPILEMLVRRKSSMIGWKVLECPVCGKDIPRNKRMVTHLSREHKMKESNIVRLYINRLLGDRLRTVLRKRDGTVIDRPWEAERCPMKNCEFLSVKHGCLVSHLQRRHENSKISEDIDRFGDFWGTIKTIVRQRPMATIEQVLGKGKVFICGVESCNMPFGSAANLRKHFSHAHGDLAFPDELAPRCLIEQSYVIEPYGIDRETTQSRLVQQPEREVGKEEEEQLWDESERQEADMRGMSEEEKMRRRQEFIRLRELHLRNVDEGVNIPKLSRKQMKRVKQGLDALFRNEIEPIMEEFTPMDNSPEEWECFEGAYEEVMHKIRRHIMVAINKDSQRLYGRPAPKPKALMQRERIKTNIAREQRVKNTLKKLRVYLEEMGEMVEEEEEREVQRRRQLLMDRVSEVFDLLDQKTKVEIFGSNNPADVWSLFYTSTEHRQRVIEWLSGLISEKVSNLMNEMNKKYLEREVREAYCTSKSIAMRRYVESVESPVCQVDPDQVTRHFEDVWSPPRQGFQSADEGSIFFLERKIPEEASDLMLNYITNEANIKEVIQSRQDLSASGTDGIGNQILKAAKGAGVKFLKKIIETSVKCGRMITSWKQAKTILLYKKGEATDLANWRPISITNCIYRIFTCLLARSIQKINQQYSIFSSSQKGFIKNTNGCSEHAILLNELVHNANRKGKNLVTTAVDFTNAFGSIPHEMILAAMNQRGFPNWVCEIVKQMYEGATSVIELRGKRTDWIGWKRGVKQGCPLSPLLFNLCLESFLQAVRHKHKGQGVSIEIAEEKEEILVQAYADDVVLVSEKPEDLQEMLQTLEEFTEWSRMEVNTKKCTTASYMLDRMRHRCALRANLKFRGQQIPNLTMTQSMRYLGTAVAARRTVKLESVRGKIIEMKERLKRIMGSKLAVIQKIDAIKTFLLPSMDFIMLNGEAGREDLRKMDQKIRGAVNQLLNLPGLPKDFHHASWRDGGLSYPSLVDRQEVLVIRSLSQMLTSQDGQIRSVMKQFVEDERKHRDVAEDEGGLFLNWADNGGRGGTASIVGRARQTCQRRGIKLKMGKESDHLIIGFEGQLDKPIKTDKIGRLLTQKLIRARRYAGLKNMMVHGATFRTLGDNTVSNRMMNNIFSKRSDAFFRYTIAARTDSLPTPANIGRWYKTNTGGCRRCNWREPPTQAHILNTCAPLRGKMTERHNDLSKVVKETIAQLIGEQMPFQRIRDNQTIDVQGLSDGLASLRPDLVFETEIDGIRRMEIMEFSCPYGYEHEGENGGIINSLQETFIRKHRKYALLAQEVGQILRIPTRVTVVIVSSLGAVYPPSLMELQKLTTCDMKTMRKFGRKMSETVIMGSMKLWREYTKTMERGTNGEEVERRIEEEIERMEQEEQEEQSKAREERLLKQIPGEEEADDEGAGEEIEIEMEEQEHSEGEPIRDIFDRYAEQQEMARFIGEEE